MLKVGNIEILARRSLAGQILDDSLLPINNNPAFIKVWVKNDHSIGICRVPSASRLRSFKLMVSLRLLSERSSSREISR